MRRRIAKSTTAASVFLLLAVGVGCQRERATLAQCQEILDRIVEVEMREGGFRDPVLLERRREEFRRLLAPELRECEEKRMKRGALACVRSASTAEQISHRCLR